MSTHNAEPFENLPDSVSIPAEDPNNWGGEPSTGIDLTKGRVRDARLRWRDLQKRIQACIDRLLAFETEEEILLFEENEVKSLDWEVRYFLKTAQEFKETGQPLGLEERVGAEFESLVRHCKARAAELSKSTEKGPPEIQLGKSSSITLSRHSSLASEIIDDQLELAHLQAEVELHEMERQAEADEAERRRQLEAEADEAERQNALARARDKVKLFKKQAEIQAKLHKQQSMGSRYSVRSSQKSKFSKAYLSIKAEVEQRLGSRFLNFNLGGHIPT